ncbi:MAG: thermonuclease family protein [Patescibacteria group bacterium]
MKYFKYIFITLIFLCCFNFVSAQNEIQETSVYVLYVIDGDTIVVSIEGKEQRVRLIGIDAPEVAYVEENKEGECFADESTEKLKELILNKEVVLVNDSLSDDKDKYNRLLRYIYLDNTDINAKLVENGYAKSFLFFPFDKQDEYSTLDSFAQLQMLGLYDTDVCLGVSDNTEVDTPYLILGIAILAVLLIIIFLKKND